ncbi:MAG TPA: MerR family transcriptional regulator [Gammaproteobacteria bacterium]|nr:MerR family transcriptional regulator [Gammaproteobacteria bacterium]
MTQWYVKDLSKLTHVSVQTLHHYDRINLLKPSDRLPNGYRVYSEKDLSTLQQILALKFFGFELAHIKKLLNSDMNLIDHFMTQSKFLEEKAQALSIASQTLKDIIADHSHDKSIPWETVINSIEVYRMTQQLENTWVAKILSPTELKDYANFEQELKTRFTETEKEAAHREWDNIVQAVHDNLNKDPSTPSSIKIAERCMTWVKNLYGNKNAVLSKAIWEKGFKAGHGTHDHGLSQNGVEWLDKAMHAYHSQRIRNVLDKIDTHTTEEVLAAWNKLLTDMYDNNQALKDELYHKIMSIDEIPQSRKDWLKKYAKK